MGESAKRHEENSNLIKEIRASTDAAIRNQGASIKTLVIQIRQMSKVLQERGFGSLPSSPKTNPRDHVKSILTIVEADASSIRRIGSLQYVIRKDCMDHNFQKLTLVELHILINPYPERRKTQGVSPYPTILIMFALIMPLLTKELATMKYPKIIAENVLVGIGKFIFLVDFINLDMPEDIKVSLILGRPIFSTAHAKIDVFKRKITLKVGEEKINFKSVKPASSLIKRVYMLSLRERMELDLEVRLMGETLVLNRSLDPLLGDYIELNDLNVPLELRRDQVDDVMPTIEEGKIIEEFRARNYARMVRIFFGYPSDCNHDKKIHIDCAHNLKFSCMIDFVVLKDMYAYCDDGMGDVIFGEPFLREVGSNVKWFEGMITIYNGNEKVTYQMVRLHQRFKHYTNEQCNKIPPLLNVSEEDKMNRISHSYQKLKNFYKGVLNLGPEYVRDAKMEEWLTCGHISVHETE
ncbi:hypothetical protein Tco_0401757 [Tanacetum coccineum]